MGKKTQVTLLRAETGLLNRNLLVADILNETYLKKRKNQ